MPDNKTDNSINANIKYMRRQLLQVKYSYRYLLPRKCILSFVFSWYLVLCIFCSVMCAFAFYAAVCTII